MANELERSKRIVIDKDFEDKINPENLKLLAKHERDMDMRGLADGTIYGYVRDLKQFLAYLVREQFNPLVLDLIDKDIEDFIYYCKKQGNNENRMLHRITSIAMFYKFLKRKKIIKEDPMEFIVRPKKGLPVVVQTYLTEVQYADMRNKLSECGDLQLQTFGMFAISTMARVTALSNTTWEQIDFENRVVEDVLEKEGKIVTLYFSEEVCELLQMLKKEREKEGVDCKYVFISKSNDEYNSMTANGLRRWAKKIGEMIGEPTLHPHDFRHSGSQLLNLAGMPIETISSLLSHSGLDVTKNHYLRENKQKMREQKDKFSI